MLKFVPRAEENAAPITGYSGRMSRLLRARGVTDAAEAEAFLRPSLDALHDPFLLSDMAKAVELISRLRDDDVRAVVYGDYDADGVCAAVILREALTRFGVRCGTYIPARHGEGYGLNMSAAEKLAKEYGTLITVDCGITSVSEVAFLKERGLIVIVTDHHTPPADLPQADAVIDPLLGDYPFPHLCGAGVAWKLAQALLGDAEEWLDLCALATIADMVPLTGENRTLAHFGLKALSSTSRVGFNALKDVSGVSGDITSEQAAFALAPRVNAGGRMASANDALELLSTKDESRAKELAGALDNLNAERKSVEAAILEEAQAQIRGIDLTRKRAIVLYGDDWNSGVIGLAAGRVAEEYCYPTVAFAREGEYVVGSARSAGDVDIYLALSEMKDLYVRFGGHKKAAGLTLLPDRLGEFADRLSDAVARQTGGDAPTPTLTYDDALRLDACDIALTDELAALAPFGMGNPTPRFLAEGIESADMRSCGAEGRHLRCMFTQDGCVRGGVMFGGGAQAAPAGTRWRALFTPTKNEYRGRTTVDMRIHALEMSPDSYNADDLSLLRKWLPDIAGNEKATAIDALPPLDKQGDLLLCRARDTLHSLLKTYPDLNFAHDVADDARAFTAIGVCLSAVDVQSPYRRVFLCDGDYGEAAALRATRPDIPVFALPRTNAANRLLSSCHADVDALRRVYLAARDGAPSLNGVADAAGVTPAQVLAALYLLESLDLIAFTAAPFHVTPKASAKKDPSLSPRYRVTQMAKEASDGEHSL